MATSLDGLTLLHHTFSLLYIRKHMYARCQCICYIEGKFAQPSQNAHTHSHNYTVIWEQFKVSRLQEERDMAAKEISSQNYPSCIPSKCVCMRYSPPPFPCGVSLSLRAHTQINNAMKGTINNTKHT